MKYGTNDEDSAISPLHQSFIEMEDPYCSDVDFTVDENVHAIHVRYFMIPST